MSWRASSRIAAWLPVIGWMLAIFVGSTDLLSSGHTSRLLGPFLNWLGLSPTAADLLQRAIRKCGHLTEYAILALLCRRALHLQARWPWRFWSGRAAIVAWAIASLYAASDEFHQSFVPTREACVRDVLIDAAGAATALLLTRWMVTRGPNGSQWLPNPAAPER